MFPLQGYQLETRQVPLVRLYDRLVGLLYDTAERSWVNP